MLTRFCTWLTETYFATDIWLPDWFIRWVHRHAELGAMGRGLARWREKNPVEDRWRE